MDHMYDDKQDDLEMGVFIGGFGFGDASTCQVWVTTRENGCTTQTPLVLLAAQILWNGFRNVLKRLKAGYLARIQRMPLGEQACEPFQPNPALDAAHETTERAA